MTAIGAGGEPVFTSNITSNVSLDNTIPLNLRAVPNRKNQLPGRDSPELAGLSYPRDLRVTDINRTFRGGIRH
jgi:hypothetical protein